MSYIGTSEAAKRLHISVERVQQLIKDGSLPAIKPARDYLIDEKDLALVFNRRGRGRPRKEQKAA